MGKKTPSPPPAPDPVVVNAAQTASNKETALYNAALNRVDQYGPQGSLTYTKLENDADGLPKYRSDTTLSPEAQKQYDIEQRVGTATSELGEAQLGRLRDALAQEFSFDGLPKAPGTEDFSVDRDKVTQSLIDRNAPQMMAARNALENKLVNQGIPRGSKAWQQAVDDLNRQQNDFNLSAISAGGAEQSRLYGLGTDARTRAIQEYTTQRNQPLNELSALLGQSQIQNPTFGAAPTAQAAPTDTSAAYNQQYQGQMAAYNNKVASQNATQGALFGLGGSLGAAAIMSDIRLKENIRHTGFEKGFPIYEFSYKADPNHITYRGVMAQDVLKTRPDAVVDDGNYMAVDYGKLGIEFVRVH